MKNKIIIITTLLMLSSCAEYEVVKIEDKERVNKMDSSYYLIFTDKEVFKNEDSLLFLKFNSSDIYGKLKRGKCYELKVRFWRVPLLSMYQNIMKFKEVKCGR